ncbi:MAG: CvpA family protein [Lachnospiraceae bacterium]|nr:CvpA family protein [Lachnospiraceae bacterium]
MQIILIIILLIYIWRIYQGIKRGLIEEMGALASILLISVAVITLVTLIESILLKNVIAFLVTGIILMILLIAWKVIKIVICSLGFIAKLPLLSSLNKLFGFLAGVVEATVIAWAVFTLLTSVEVYVGNVLILDGARQNVFVNFLYENNMLHEGLQKIIDIFPPSTEPISILKKNQKIL